MHLPPRKGHIRNSLYSQPEVSDDQIRLMLDATGFDIMTLDNTAEEKRNGWMMFAEHVKPCMKLQITARALFALLLFNP